MPLPSSVIFKLGLRDSPRENATGDDVACALRQPVVAMSRNTQLRHVHLLLPNFETAFEFSQPDRGAARFDNFVARGAGLWAPGSTASALPIYRGGLLNIPRERLEAFADEHAAATAAGAAGVCVGAADGERYPASNMSCWLGRFCAPEFNPRAHLIRYSSTHPRELDARMSSLSTVAGSKRTLRRITDIMALPSAPTDSLGRFRAYLGGGRGLSNEKYYGAHRVVLHTHGVGSAGRLRTHLATGQCVILHRGGWEEWWYGLVEPWVHVVPLADDLSNLTQVRRFN